MNSMKRICNEALSLLTGLGILLLLLAVIFVSCMTLFNACSLYEDEIITVNTREDGAYTVKLLQTGVPFLVGPTSAAVALYDENGKRVDFVTFALGNDGGNVEEKNLKSVVWGEDSVTVTVKGFEEDEARSYVLTYPKK